MSPGSFNPNPYVQSDRGERGMGNTAPFRRAPSGHRAWVGEKAPHLLPTHNAERLRIQEKLQALNEMGGRPVAHIAARNSGIREKDSPAEAAGGLARKNYLRRGARCMLSSAVWQEWGLYNGAIGEVAGLGYRPGDRPPRPFPSCVLVAP